MVIFYIELLYDFGSQAQSPHRGGKGTRMNQNGFVPRNNMPGYTYGQSNIPPQNGYPGSGMPLQTGAPAAEGFSFTPPGGYSPVSQATAATGYSAGPQMTGPGGYNPVPQTPAAGGYPPVSQAPIAGGYSPVQQAPSTGGYSPIPQMNVPGGYSPVPPPAANGAYPVYHPQTAPAAPGGSFIPKTPYSSGFTGPQYPQGYQKPAANGYPQGYSAYGQMGKNVPQNTAPQGKPEQVPLNGGGYVPQQVKIRKRPPERADILLYAVGGILLILFILGMFIPVNGFQWLKWLFLIPAAGTVALLWIRPITDDGKRLCFSVVAGALCIAMIISLIGASGSSTGDPTRNNGSSRSATAQQSGVQNTQQAGPSGEGSSTGGVSAVNAPGENNGSSDDGSGYGGSNLQSGTAVANAAAKERLAQVFISWSMNDLDQMVELCPPSWRVKQENAKKSLFQLLQNRTPIGNVDLVNDPAQNGDSLSFILQVTISRNNGKQPILSQMTVRMVTENGVWYVDPNSLKSNEIQETPDPNATPVVTATPEPYVDNNTPLYYNPDGGKLYHLDPSCISVHSKYTPLKGTFTYGQINEGTYAGLEPCNVCGAPLRK